MALSDKSDAEILSIVDPLMDNLMDASNAIDFERHLRDFTPRLKALISPEGLERMCAEVQAEYGKYGRRELVRIFRRPGSVAVVWTQYHDGSDHEFVASIVVVEGEDGTHQIDHVLIC